MTWNQQSYDSKCSADRSLYDYNHPGRTDVTPVSLPIPHKMVHQEGHSTKGCLGGITNNSRHRLPGRSVMRLNGYTVDEPSWFPQDCYFGHISAVARNSVCNCQPGVLLCVSYHWRGACSISRSRRKNPCFQLSKDARSSRPDRQVGVGQRRTAVTMKMAPQPSMCCTRTN